MVSFIGPFSHLLLGSSNMNSTAGDLYGRREDTARNTHHVRHSANEHSMQTIAHILTQTKPIQCKQIEQIKRCPDTNNEYIYIYTKKRKHHKD